MTSNVVRTKLEHHFSESEQQARTDLAACYRLASRFGFDEIIWNHITARIPGPHNHFLLHQFGLRYDEVTASNLLKVDQQGCVVDSPDDINVTGFVIHSGIYTARADVACVLHTHSPGAVAVSALERGLIPMAQGGMMFYDNVAYHDYEGLSTDVAERDRLATNLGDKCAMILRNHGVLTVGRSVSEAFMLMYHLEDACRLQMQVLSSGEKMQLPPAEVCQRARDQFKGCWPGKYEWPALIRLLDKEDRSYRD